VSGGQGLSMPAALRRAVVVHARRERPLECCGFVVGAGRRVQFVVACTNVAKSAVRYRIDDRTHIELRRVLRTATPGLRILGVYHSHPEGEPWPSETDVAEAYYPEWTYVIVGFRGRRSTLRAFRIRNGRVRQVPLR
jgi:proteasome lid subunit RPN8/RPN11